MASSAPHILYVVRHSTRVSKDFDSEISEAGKELAYQTVKELKESLGDLSSSVRLWSSPFTRVAQTAGIFSEVLQVPIIFQPLLLEGLNIESFPEPPKIPTYLIQPYQEAKVQHPETESDLTQRIQNLLTLINQDSSNTPLILLTHGIICNMILRALVPSYSFTFGATIDPDTYRPRYCEVIKVVIPSEGTPFIQ